MIRSKLYTALKERLSEPRRFIQVLAGPRQVGKTTVARQYLADCGIPGHYATADEPALKGRDWLVQQWETGRLLAAKGPSVLVLDEIQKIPAWSETVKALWDSDSQQGVDLKVLCLGSSPLLLQSGLTESLAGRFEILPAPHWSYAEMNEAFGWDLETFLYHGAYPGAASLVDRPGRWRQYLLDSLIETSISRDILLMTRVDKPALLRHLFQLACDYSGQILSYQKMLGQLADAGNTVTLAHYLRLLQGAGMVAGLPKFCPGRIRQRASSPKLQVMNTAFMSVLSGLDFEEFRRDRARWGRLVESAVGAHLLNGTLGTDIELSYWRERGQEVDFVLGKRGKLVAIEVKSSGKPGSIGGMEAFRKAFRSPVRCLLVGGDGIPLDLFLRTPAEQWF